MKLSIGHYQLSRNQGCHTRASFRRFPFTAFLALVLLLPGHAEAQLGGLIKKKVSQATAGPMVGEPVKFDNVTLEITPDRINKLIAAKRAAKQFADGPNGPGAYEAKIEALDAQQAAIYQKQVGNINGLEAKQQERERCLDSAFSALRDKANARTPQSLNDPQMQKFMQMSQQMAMAQARGDTAEVRKIIALLERMKQPTRADTLAAQNACGPVPVQSPIIKQWYDLKAQLDSLAKQKAAADDSLRAMEQRLSGMDARQSAVFCERTKAYIAQLKTKQKQGAFTDDELKTMANLAQAIKDLEALCP